GEEGVTFTPRLEQGQMWVKRDGGRIRGGWGGSHVFTTFWASQNVDERRKGRFTYGQGWVAWVVEVSRFNHVLAWPKRGVGGGMVGMGLAYVSASVLHGQNVAQGWPNVMCVCISVRVGLHVSQT
ncbi:hypothetical protein PIB30_095502, partial [Stylosanthes scabra]|nr:hypothetical protein [Stylosanthes scabra]